MGRKRPLEQRQPQDLGGTPLRRSVRGNRTFPMYAIDTTRHPAFERRENSTLARGLVDLAGSPEGGLRLARNIANVYTITGLTNIVLGTSLMAASTAAGAVLPAGYAQVAFGGGAIFGKLTDQNRRKADRVLKKFRNYIEKQWPDWSEIPDAKDDGLRASVLLSFDQVIPKIQLDSSEIVAERLDPDRMANLMLQKAEAAMPSVYGAHLANDRDATVARAFLWDISHRAYQFLAEQDDYINDIVPDLWKDLLGQVERIENAVVSSADKQAERLARIEAMLMEAVAEGPKVSQARANGITDEALIGLARRIASDVEDADQAFVELERAVDLAIQVQSYGAQSDAPVAVSRAAAQSAQGDYDDAASTIGDALAEAEAAHKSQMSALLQAGFEQDMLRRDPTAAAHKLVRLQDADAGGLATFDDLAALWMTWYSTGRDSGAILDLTVAQTLAQQMALRATSPLEHGTALNYLGIILHIRGEREEGPQRLSEAMGAFEQALTHWTRDVSADHWAKGQMNLANSTHALAQRDPGNDRIGRAIEAYEAALSVRNETNDPQAWAILQMNLATALRTLADQRDEAALLASLAAVEAALSVRTRDTSPPQWAMTVLNRALSQADLAAVRADATLLDPVFADMDEALTIWPAQTAAYYRATVLMHKGAALRRLAQLTGTSDPLTQSRHCLAEALELFAQDSTPIDRLTAQGHDALTQLSLSGRQTAANGEASAQHARERLTQICRELSDAGHIGGAERLQREAANLSAAAPDTISQMA